ncbi:non-hydrolyzing UDP-N-acetylglucosamine 2-epimerase [Megalodesulfovibrio paquesii]
MRTVLLVGGARPNFMKLAPLLRELRTRHTHRVRPCFVHTGQHYDAALSGEFLRQFDMPAPDHALGVGSGSHAEQTAAILVAFERVCLAEQPKQVVVVGDVNSTLACALAAAKLHIPVAHVEAGLRSFDRSMPEEINRLLTDALADQCFVTEPSGVEHLLAEGKQPEQIHLVGNLMIDTLFQQLALLQSQPLALPCPELQALPGSPYVVVTLHRPSNVDQPARLQDLARALMALAARLPVCFPLHPRTRQRLEAAALLAPLAAAGVRLLPPLGYAAFLTLWKDAALVLTDSGGLQEETTALGVPCLTLRPSTERPITLELGTNRLVPGGAEEIQAAAEEVLREERGGRGRRGRIEIPLWDGRAAGRVAETVNRLL